MAATGYAQVATLRTAGEALVDGELAAMDAFEFDLASFISFRDREACERVRGIPRSSITKHANPDFRIRVIDDRQSFYGAFAADLVQEIAAAREEDRSLVLILPAGPVPQYRIAAEAINGRGLTLSHTFNMDEFADEHGKTAPRSWRGSFQRGMWDSFFGLIDPELMPPLGQIHFPSDATVNDYSRQIEELGGADVCYGGIGWGGHIAFWEPQLGAEFGGDMAAYQRAGSRIVELHPMTIMQNALHSFGGDWSAVPPMAATIGPRDILGAKRRSLWLDGDLGGGMSWQRFIARLCAHGPLSEFVPGSLVQAVRTDYTMLGGVADDIVVQIA